MKQIFLLSFIIILSSCATTRKNRTVVLFKNNLQSDTAYVNLTTKEIKYK